MLENKFKTLCQNLSNDEELINNLWQEIKSAHTQAKRYYHTLQHLQHIYTELEDIKLITHFEFAIFYHDIIYDIQRDDNEEQSALLAKKRLTELNVHEVLQEKVFEVIIETAKHEASSKENSLFLDADLAILGSSPKSYEQYIKNVRKEYALYSDKAYVSGRKKVLKSFLEKERIYKSNHFYKKYEQQAKVNIKSELNSLC